jgi:lysozyme
MNPATDALLQLLKLHEGYRQHPYADLGGAQSVGYGRNLTDNGITEPEASYLLLNDTNRSWTELEESVPCFRVLDDVRKCVLVDMCVNMGIRRLLRFVRMLAALSNRNYEAAASEMMDSVWSGQVGPRAVRLSEMMRSGRWPSEIHVDADPPSDNWFTRLWRQ